MNAALFRFPKPVATFLQGFTMGGGVGVGCHGSHRIVCETSRIAMPECGIGLVPDVGGTLILARAPGRLGEYLGTTGARMGPGDAIHAGFADYFVPSADWPGLIARLVETGDWEEVDRAACPPPAGPLAAARSEIDAVWGGETLGDIYRAMPETPTEAVAEGFRLMDRNAPLAMAVTVQNVHRLRLLPSIEKALDQEYRFTFRAMEQGDFLEGIRAAVIDKDRNPRWKHGSWRDVRGGDVTKMTLPLGRDALVLED
jgi:enoyl-CoA hydratase/carnithine racemase